MTTEEDITKIRENVSKEKNVAGEFNNLLNSLENAESKQEKEMIENQIKKLRISIKNTNDELLKNLEQTNMSTPLIKSANIKIEESKKILEKENKIEKSSINSREKLSEMDRDILKRMKKDRERKTEKTEKKTSDYVRIANKFFSKFSMSVIKQKQFKTIGRDLIKAHLDYNFVSYLSLMFFNTVIAFAISFFIFIFLLFFNIGSTVPIISKVIEGFGIRLLEIFWILIIIPLGTFLFMSVYPSMEKKSLGNKIDAELPFAAIHMAAISGSMIDPTKIFSIISSTKEYPHLEKEFNKLLNEINVYGYDLVTALKDLALNSPSSKLADLLNGLATTITSGGNLYDFFDKRSQSLLFEYRLDKEKETKAAESFMDIYISIVIAGPMIFMLLLIMMKVSGLGISLSTSTITFLVVGGVSLINIFFLMFLQLKQKATA